MPDEPEHDDRNTEDVPEQRRPYAFVAGENRPGQLTAVAILVAVEGLALIALGIWWGFEALFGKPADQNLAIMLGVLVILVGALLVRMSVALWKVEVWPRAPVVVLNIPAVPIGWSVAFKSGYPVPGVAVIVLAVLVIGLMFSKPVKEAFGRDA